MNSLSDDILIEILNYIDESKELINCELISKQFQHIVRNTRWIHIPFRIRNLSYFDHVINNYKIGNWDFSYCEIEDKQIKLIKNCHTIDVSFCNKITGDGLVYLENFRDISLTYSL